MGEEEAQAGSGRRHGLGRCIVLLSDEVTAHVKMTDSWYINGSL